MAKKISTPATELRADIKNESKNFKLRSLTYDEFKTYTNQVMYLDESIFKFKNQIRAAFVNNEIRESSLWDKICELRKVENDEDDSKVMVAKLVKEALVEVFTRNPYIREEITMKNVEAYVNKKVEHEVELSRLVVTNIILRDNMLKEIEKYMKENMPVYEWCKEVRGLGTKLTAKLLAGIGDIRRFENPSKIWTYCGIGNAAEQTLRKGVQANWSPKMKTLMYLIGEQFILSGSQYKVVYEQRKKITLKTHPEWHNAAPDPIKNVGKDAPKQDKDGNLTWPNKHPKHAHTDARRVMVKRFLSELYDAWYKSIGMEPPAQPYGVEIKGHHREEQIVEYKKSGMV